MHKHSNKLAQNFVHFVNCIFVHFSDIDNLAPPWYNSSAGADCAELTNAEVYRMTTRINQESHPIAVKVTPEFCAALGITTSEALIEGQWYYAFRLPNGAALVPFGTFVKVWSRDDITEWRACE